MDERLLKIHALIGIIKDAEAELEFVMAEPAKGAVRNVVGIWDVVFPG